MIKKITIISIVVFFVWVTVAPVVIGENGTTYYVDATNGNDSNNGLSLSNAWKTIAKVRTVSFNPGDSILFKRGEVWREHLMISSLGTSEAPITFGAYGMGEKPLILGSVERNDVNDWVNEGGNIWSTVDLKDGNELLNNPSFDENTDGWVFSVGGNADASLSRDTETYDSSPASVRIDCVNNALGDGQSWLYVYSAGIHIVEGEWHVFSFKAKASSQFDVYTINLLKSGNPDDYYSIKSFPIDYFPVTTEWKTFNVYFLADTTANDGQILLDLQTLPNGESIYIDTLSFQKSDKAPLIADVGSIILDNEESVGVKVQHKGDLDTQGEFWFDSSAGQLKMYSAGNPANVYSDIECALGTFLYKDKDIWSVGAGPIVYIMADYITVENLDLRYGGADGIWGEEVNNVIIRNCDISYCGGTHQDETKVRMGNGITFWEETHDCRVEGCRFWEIYDAAISNQGEKTNTQSNLHYLNNIIWNSEYSFEIWNKPESSAMNNIYVENNTCIAAGFGWSHKQRPDPHGWHLALWGNHATTNNIYIRNNVFYEAAFSALYFDTSETEYESYGLVSDNNYYYQDSGYMMVHKYDKAYTMNQFSIYQSDKDQDLNSVTGDKGIVKETARSMVSSQDEINLLNELFITTDTLEPTKNEGVTLEGAEFDVIDEQQDQQQDKESDSDKETPGFEILILLLTAMIIIYIKKRKNKD